MAGLRFFENEPITAFPATVISGQGMALLTAGYLDVTRPPYSADPTGAVDSADAFQAAITFGYLNNLAVWAPKGSYLWSHEVELVQILNFKDGSASNRKYAPQIYGDCTGGNWPTIIAQDGAFGSGQLVHVHFDPITDQFGPGRTYNIVFRGFNIDMGNNPNATAIRFLGAQWCALEDVNIFGTFNIGVNGLPASGGSSTNITVTGGNIGVAISDYRPTPSIQGLRCIDQAVAGVQVGGVRNALCLAGFEIRGAPVGIRSTGRGANQPSRNFVLIDGLIDTDGLCFDCEGSNIYAKNVYVRSAAGAIMENGTISGADETINAAGWRRINELAFAEDGAGNNSPLMINGAATAPDGFALSMEATAEPDAEALIAAHTWNPNTFPTWFNTPTLDLRDYGATIDDPDSNNAPALNALLADSAATGKPAFIPRGFWYTQAPMVCPKGAKVIGSSFCNCVINSGIGWKPTAATDLFVTENAEGDVLLADFCINGHDPHDHAARDIESHKFIRLFHGRTSNMLLRCVQINRREWFGPNEFFLESAALFSGNAGGRIYNLALDLFHGPLGTGGSVAPGYRMFLVDGTDHPLIIYNPDTEGAGSSPQIEIRNASNVVWLGLKFEEGGPALLDIVNSDNVMVLGGSGNYGAISGGMFRIVDSTNTALAVQGRQGADGGQMLLVNGEQVFGDFNLLTLYRTGSPTLPVLPAFPNMPPGPRLTVEVT